MFTPISGNIFKVGGESPVLSDNLDEILNEMTDLNNEINTMLTEGADLLTEGLFDTFSMHEVNYTQDVIEDHGLTAASFALLDREGMFSQMCGYTDSNEVTTAFEADQGDDVKEKAKSGLMNTMRNLGAKVKGWWDRFWAWVKELWKKVTDRNYRIKAAMTSLKPNISARIAETDMDAFAEKKITGYSAAAISSRATAIGKIIGTFVAAANKYEAGTVNFAEAFSNLKSDFATLGYGFAVNGLVKLTDAAKPESKTMKEFGFDEKTIVTAFDKAESALDVAVAAKKDLAEIEKKYKAANAAAVALSKVEDKEKAAELKKQLSSFQAIVLSINSIFNICNGAAASMCGQMTSVVGKLNAVKKD